MVKVLVERKTFLIRLEGKQGGEWCSITEISRGSVFALGFEKDAVEWLVDYLTKALALKSHMGFNKKFRGKCRVHLMEVGFNIHGRFIRISEYATNRKPSVLIIPEGDKGRGWENIKHALSSLLVAHYPNVLEKGRNIRGESWSHNYEGSMHRSYAKVVNDEGPRGSGLVPIGRWARAVLCESKFDRENWAEVGRSVARSLGKKGVITVVPISARNGVFFVETIEEAIFLHDLRKIKVGERNIIQLRRWSPKENAEIDGKFREGWIELRGLPFHLWSEVHLKKIVEQWGTVKDIDWRTLKLFDLSRARLKIAMRDKAILPALLEVSDGEWVFTVVVVVVGDEEGRRGGEKGESTRVAGASHSGTDGGKQGKSGRSTAGGRCRVGEDNRQRKEEEKGKAMITSAGKCDKGHQLPSQSSLKTDGMDGIEATGGEWAGEDEAIPDVGCRACERKAQSLARPGLSAVISGCKLKGPMGLGLSPEGLTPFVTGTSLRKEEDSSSAIEKGKPDPGPLEVQSSRLAKKKVLHSSRKMWSTFFPPSSEKRRGIRCSNEPISRRKTKVDSEGDSRAEDSGAESQAKRGLSASSLFSPRFPRPRKKKLGERASEPRKEKISNNASSDEDMEGFLGRVESDPRGSAVMGMPSSPVTRGKGPNLLGNCGSMVAESLEVTPSLFQSNQQYIPSSSGFTNSLLNPSVPIPSPSTPLLPVSASQSLAPTENQVNSEFFFKKVNDAFKGQITVDIPNSEMEVIQPACPNQMCESVNPFSASSKAAVNLGGTAGSPKGEFQIEGLSPRKMAKVCEVLKSLDIKVYSRRKSRCSTGL